MKKRTSMIITAIALSAVLIAGATYAWFTAETDTETNTFTASSGIAIELTEPAWNEENATNYVPGRVIPKDPTVTNTSTDDNDIWVAIKLNYTGDFDGYEIDFDDTNWTANENETVWYYNDVLSRGAFATLFNTVTINDEIDEVENFKIEVTAYGVQAEGLSTLGDAMPELNDLMMGSEE